MGSLLTQPHKARSQAHHRAIAWLLMFVCAWMGTGGVLHHTDEEAGVFFRNHAASSLHRQIAASPSDTCAACEWTQGLTAKTSTVPQLSWPLICLLSYTLSFSPHRAVPFLRLRPSRAPPAFV